LAVDVDAGPREGSRGAFGRLVRYLDVPLAVLALPVAIALGAPRLGVALGVGGWLAQRVLAEVDRRWMKKVTTPLRQLGVTLFEGFARIWLLAGVIIISAVVGGRRDGLTTSIVVMGAYSVAFGTKLLLGPPKRRAAAP
jgi:hypothetical protein